MDSIAKAQQEAASSPAVVEAAKVVKDAAKALVDAPEDAARKAELDKAVHAQATAMSDALIEALLKTTGGRRKTRRGRRSTRKSRR